MKVSLVDHMGSDLSIVNAARVSFDTHHDSVKEGDHKLIKYLADHNHWSPFAHTSLQFRIKAPIFVARQLAKHQVGLVWNEISRRYVDSELTLILYGWELLLRWLAWYYRRVPIQSGTGQDLYMPFTEYAR